MRLLFGHASSPNLARLGLNEILLFGERLCPLCKGEYSETYPKEDQQFCTGISHAWARLAMAGYVDDILVAEWEQSKLLAIFDYGEKLLELQLTCTNFDKDFVLHFL